VSKHVRITTGSNANTRAGVTNTLPAHRVTTKIPPAKNGKPKPERSEAEVGKLLGRPRQTISHWTSITPAHVGKCNKPPSYQVTMKIPPAKYADILERAVAVR